MRRFDRHHDYIIRRVLIPHHAVHSEESGGLFHWQPPFGVSLDMEMRHSGTFFIKKILFSCDRRLGGSHRMHLCTSADHSHLDLSVRNPKMRWNRLLKYKCTSERGERSF